VQFSTGVPPHEQFVTGRLACSQTTVSEISFLAVTFRELLECD